PDRVLRSARSQVIAVRPRPAPGGAEVADGGLGGKPNLAPPGSQPPAKLGLEPVRDRHEVLIEAAGLQGPLAPHRQVAGHAVQDRARLRAAEGEVEVLPDALSRRRRPSGGRGFTRLQY